MLPNFYLKIYNKIFVLLKAIGENFISVYNQFFKMYKNGGKSSQLLKNKDSQ